MAKNAIEKRLDVLHDQYTEFAQVPEARVLRWLVRPDEVRMIETFVESENDEHAGATPDLFVLIRQPFADPPKHGYAIVQELVDGYAQTREALAAEGFDGDWRPPPTPAGSDIGALLRVAGSFRDHYDELVTHLVLVLLPHAVDDPAIWDQWLRLLADHMPAPEVRVIVLDDADAPQLVQLAEGRTVMTQVADLDMPEALEDLAKSAGGFEHPGALYRVKFTELSQAASVGDLDKARAAADAASQIARANNWAYLVVPAKFALAGALVQAGRVVDALPVYREAEAAAAESEAAGEAHGTLLRVQSRLAIGATLIAAEAHEQAASIYESTVPFALATEDPLYPLECWRMAGYCHECTRRWDDAWRCGLEGVAVVRGMALEARQQSTSAYLGEGLLRVTEASSTHRGQRASVEHTMAELLGTTDWRPKGPQNPPYPPPVPAQGEAGA